MERAADHSGAPPSASFPADGGHYHQENSQEPHFHGGRHQTDQRYASNFHGEQNDSSGYQMNGTSNSSNSFPQSGQKRPFSHSNSVGSGSYVKLYVVGISRSSTEQDIRAVFAEHGQILEVVLLKDKKTGIQQEACFVKYATFEQAERAMGAFHGPYTFPGASIPMKVRFADGERGRLGILGLVHKLYVGCVNRQAEKNDIEEIFSPFGIIEEVFMVRDEFKQSRGCAFVQFLNRSMALAAIQALNGTYVMRGCDQPLIVRFAEPKRPRVGDSSFFRPAPHVNGTTNGHMMSNEAHHIKFLDSECKMPTMANNGTASASHAFNTMDATEPSIECDWSEHVSPDGDLYYYNCVTCESRWEKPEEYAVYEKQLDNLGERQPQLQEFR